MTGGTAVLAELADLEREQRGFAELLSELDGDDWARPSTAPGWTVRDQVAHLADTEEVAADTIAGGARAFAEVVPGYATAEDFTESGCRRGDGLSPAELLRWWTGAAARTRELLGSTDPAQRVGWGFGMPAATFAAARLMEHWAHGLDIRDALGLPVAEESRLRHVAGLGHATLRYALGRARVRWPQDRTLRLELSGVDGALHEFGPADATDVLRGPLLHWCRVATRRPVGAPGGDPAAELHAEGELARLAVVHARAYL